MKKALILTAALFSMGFAAAPSQAAGPVSQSGLAPIAQSGANASLQEIARRKVCRRSCVVRGYGYKKKRVCRQVCRWR